jgi:DNA cross-link repair 1A protein
MLGQEDVLFEVSRAFGSKIHVDRDKNPDCHYRLSHVAPEILTDDPVSRFHVMSFPRLSDRATEILALARSRQEPEPLIIRPSSQWYAYCEAPEASVKRRPVLTEPMRDEFGVWHVCLSMHSSREELEQALGILRPRWVVSTTPPCIAMDLSYVKKHCCLSRLCPDDPLWKLIGVPDGMTTVTVAPQPSERTVEAIEESEAAVACTVEEFGSDDSVHVEVAEPTLEGFEIRVEPPLTLFGRARFGLLPDESQLWRDDYASVELIDDVEIKATEQATEIGPSKEGMADKSVEVTEISEVSGKVRNLANESDGELKAIDLAEDDIHIFSKAAEFRMDDNNVKLIRLKNSISMRTTA